MSLMDAPRLSVTGLFNLPNSHFQNCRRVKLGGGIGADTVAA